MADDLTIRVQNLNQFRRDVKRADRTVAKELQAELGEVAKDVAREATSIAPRGQTGALAGGYRGVALGGKGVVRNRVFYSRFIEFGFRPGGGSRFVEGQHPIGRAIERREDQIVEDLGDAIENAALKLGWH
jgi:hypothetical protein